MAVANEVRDMAGFHGVFKDTDTEASEPETVDLLAMFVAFIRPKIVVEAGTYRGHLCCSIANVFRRAGIAGHIYTADVQDQGIEARIASDPPGRLLLPYISFYHGDYVDMLDTVPGPIDLAYIDASDILDSHQRLRHATLTFNRLSPGGLIFVDDTAALDWDDAQVFRERANLYLAPHRGLSIIQAPY